MAGSLSYWIPTITLASMNVSSFLQNVVGATIIAVATSFQQIKFQYTQTYFMYVC